MKRSYILLGLLLSGSALQAASADVPVNLSVVDTIKGPDGGWDYASVDPDAHRLYIARRDGVMAVDLGSGKVTEKLVEGKRLHSVLPLPGGRALSTNGGGDNATLFEAATGKVIATIATGMDPDAALYDPASGLALVIDGKGGDITLIDPKAGTSPGSFAVGGRLEAATLDGAGRLFVNDIDTKEVAIVDIAKRQVTAHYALPDCRRPAGLAFDPVSGLLVTACANGKALALRAKDGSIAATLPIGERPDAVLFDPTRKLFFVSCGEGKLIAVSATATPAVVATIATANGARTAALDAKTGKIYLPTADFAQPVEGSKRHKVIPGTFRVLVVGEKQG